MLRCLLVLLPLPYLPCFCQPGMHRCVGGPQLLPAPPFCTIALQPCACQHLAKPSDHAASHVHVPSACLSAAACALPAPSAAYLESALASGAASPATYEQELARIYLESIAAATRASGSKRSASRTDTASTGTGSSTGTSSSWQQRGPSKRDAAEAAAAAEDAAAEEATTAGQASAEASLPEFAKLKQLVRACLAA